MNIIFRIVLVSLFVTSSVIAAEQANDGNWIETFDTKIGQIEHTPQYVRQGGMIAWSEMSYEKPNLHLAVNMTREVFVENLERAGIWPYQIPQMEADRNPIIPQMIEDFIKRGDFMWVDDHREVHIKLPGNYIHVVTVYDYTSTKELSEMSSSSIDNM